MQKEMNYALCDDVTGEEEVCKVTFYIDPYVEAKTYGEAENCSEAEGGFVYDTEVINSKGQNITASISDVEMGRIKEDCFNHAISEYYNNQPDEDYNKDTGND